MGSRPVPGGGAVGYCVPFGWSGLFRCLGAQRPGGPACPAGVPISPEKWGERGPGASPLDPRFYGPLVPTRSFWRLWRIVPVEGLLRAPCTCPDLETFFHKMLFQHIFPENASQIGLSIPEEIAPQTYQSQQSPNPASGNERAIKKGGAGGIPPRLFASGLSLEKAWIPRPGPGGNPPRRF